MIKTKKKIWVIVCAVLLFTISVGIFAGCNQGKKKYDVAIRIGCSDGNVYEFPVGTDEMHIEIPYDGIERRYGITAYNLPDHPRWSKEWLSPSGEGANVFSHHIIYGNNESWLYEVKSILERGRYAISFEADSTSDLWNYRYVYLYVTVK